MDDRELCQNFGNLDESNKFLQKLPNIFLKDGKTALISGCVAFNNLFTLSVASVPCFHIYRREILSVH